MLTMVPNQTAIHRRPKVSNPMFKTNSLVTSLIIGKKKKKKKSKTAISKHWVRITEIPPNETIVIDVRSKQILNCYIPR